MKPRALRLQLVGTFDVRAAREVAGRLEEAAAGDRVEIDLSHVVEFQDFGIAVLAQALKQARRVDVRLTGLRQHQLKVMRYFGLDAGAMSAP